IRAQEEEAMRGEEGPSRPAAGGVSPPDLVSRYAGLISDQIRRHWILHEELARQAQDERLAVVVGIVVRRDGAVLRSWIDESSGASLFDDAALRAVSRASPLPAFTSGMNEDQLEVALRFRAEDLL
ncbi:MAG: TonB C-terminal domain-containing protein, partial [Candidatus Methylomirabilis sp.]|nr:TonB C-terminal domain-containing protein [Deltaproteobacteria bacterium]